MKPILSVRDLAWQIGIPAQRIREIAGEIRIHYRESAVTNKKTGIIRRLWIPKPELMNLLRRLNRVLTRFELHSAAHGGVRGRCPGSNASLHLGQPCVVTLDVKRYFPSVRHEFVYNLFRREFGFGRDVAHLVTRLTTFRDQLPQGSPTSTTIANLLPLGPIDTPLAALATECGLAHTRFLDDIALSGRDPRELINTVAQLLSTRRLPMWRKKTKLKIMPNHRRQEVTGLIVNSKIGPSLSRDRRANVRAAIFQLREFPVGLEKDAARRSIRGRVAHVKQFNPGTARRLQRYLDSSVR